MIAATANASKCHDGQRYMTAGNKRETRLFAIPNTVKASLLQALLPLRPRPPTLPDCRGLLDACQNQRMAICSTAFLTDTMLVQRLV